MIREASNDEIKVFGAPPNRFLIVVSFAVELLNQKRPATHLKGLGRVWGLGGREGAGDVFLRYDLSSIMSDPSCWMSVRSSPCAIAIEDQAVTRWKNFFFKLSNASLATLQPTLHSDLSDGFKQGYILKELN